MYLPAAFHETDAAALHALMREHPQATPWAVDDAPEDFVRQMLRAVVGIEIEVSRLAGKFKLGQNRPAADRRAVAAGLDGGDAPAQALAQATREALDRSR
jgi:transcriptional regulator